jgi:hypothetical protein
MAAAIGHDEGTSMPAETSLPAKLPAIPLLDVLAPYGEHTCPLWTLTGETLWDMTGSWL